MSTYLLTFNKMDCQKTCAILLLSVVAICAGQVFQFDQSGLPRDDQQKVHIIYMNHLDVGYNGIPKTGFINNVLNAYFQEYFPRAIDVANELKDKGYVETFIYTTHPWLVSMYMDCPPNLELAGVKLQCPNATQKADFVKAVNDGFITWHAGPMNMQIENYADPDLFTFSLNIGAELDKTFKIQRPTRVLSQRDVPGMTQAAIPYMVKSGITAVSVGVNNMTPPPAVPNPFVWEFQGQSVIGTWHKGGYPDNPGPNPSSPGGLSRDDCVVVDGVPDVLCFAFRTDNSGPPMNAAEVLGYYEILRRQFPGAILQASTLESYIAALLPHKSMLPTVSNEIGDTWIVGIAADPRKMAEYRAVTRVLHDCIRAEGCSYSDPRVANASRLLTKLPEHTWGLPSVGDTINWSNEQFDKVKTEQNYKNCSMAWEEQRGFTYVAVDAMGNHSVVPAMVAALKDLKPEEPYLEGYTRVPMGSGKVYNCSGLEISFGLDGAIDHFAYQQVEWAGPSNPLGVFQYFSYNEDDFDKFGKQYDYNHHSAGFVKYNSTMNAHPESREWPVAAQELYAKSDGSCDFFVHVKPVDAKTWVKYGAPQDIWLQYVGRKNGKPGVDITLQFFDKTSTRLPEALFFSIWPQYIEGATWSVSKLGYDIDPMNVILNGSQYQHGSDDGVKYTTKEGRYLHFSSLDVPLVCPIVQGGHPTAFPAPLSPLKTPIEGFSFNLYNNIWDTNYIFWYPYMDGDDDFKARFSLQIGQK